MAYHLVVPTGTRVPLPLRPLRFGSTAEADVCLGSDLGLSPVHFALQPLEGGTGFTLISLIPDSPVLVNDSPATRRALAAGDRILAGHFRMTFEADDLPEAASRSDGGIDTPTPSSSGAQSAFFQMAPASVPPPGIPESPMSEFEAASRPPGESFRLFGHRHASGPILRELPKPAPPLARVGSTSMIAAREPKLSMKTACVAGAIVAGWLWAGLETLRPSWDTWTPTALAKVPCYLAGAAGIGVAVGWIISMTYHRDERLKRRNALLTTAVGAVLTLFILALPVGMSFMPGSVDGIGQLVENVQNLRTAFSPDFSWSTLAVQFLQPWAILGLLAGLTMAWRCADE
ncbi:MAG: hypothetical protein JNJ83_03715 [Verrucomicrobiaceae bacterium]|nr:hypothetical protein [Verrucomicrobiaceae bacterium]